MKKYLVLAVFISAAFLAYVVYLRQDQKQVNALPPPQALPTLAPSPTVKPSENAIQYPVGGFRGNDGKNGDSSHPDQNVTLDESGPTFESALKHLLGEEAVKEFIQLKDFPRRVVVAVDNLPNKHLSTEYWPVKPVPGKFQVSARNQERYAPYLTILKAIDSQEAVDLYVRLYPLFQKAYDELGTGRYFNDRVIEVIDHLLQTPTPATPPKLVRAIESYHYEDSTFESLSIGQKTLIRIGPENEEKVKASLKDLRQRLTHL